MIALRLAHAPAPASRSLSARLLDTLAVLAMAVLVLAGYGRDYAQMGDER